LNRGKTLPLAIYNADSKNRKLDEIKIFGRYNLTLNDVCCKGKFMPESVKNVKKKR
jgi:hypothetical protein